MPPGALSSTENIIFSSKSFKAKYSKIISLECTLHVPKCTSLHQE